MCVYVYVCLRVYMYIFKLHIFYDLGKKIAPWVLFHSSLNSCFSLKGKLRDGFIYKIIQIVGHMYYGS